MATTRGKKLLTALVAGVFCMGMLLASPLVAAASAADLGGYYYAGDGSRVDASPNEAWSMANELGTGMGITQDWVLSSRLATTTGKTVYIELNGNVVNRNLSSGANGGEVLRVEDGSTLSVYGGTKEDPAAKSDVLHNVGMWETNLSGGALNKVAKDVRGGVITGGYSTNGGGGVEMREGATLNLNHVTVCGNRAKTSGTDGYGGGVHMARDGGTLDMDHANIVYNYAQEEGGGVFVNGGSGREDASNCQIRMKHSHIDYNGATDNGAGVAIRGSNCKLVGDAKQVVIYSDYSNRSFWYDQVFSGACADTPCGSTIACNVIQDSDNDGGGAGVYLYSMVGGSNSCAVSGVNIIGNNALKGGSGGGIFSNKEEVCISDCNVAYNFADKEAILFATSGGYGGGIDVYNDLNTIKDCTIVGNSSARSGGGVFVYGTVNVTLGGKMIVRDNSRSDGTQDNMYLSVDVSQKARIVVDGLSSDSRIGLTLDSLHNDGRVACGTSARLGYNNAGETIDQRIFTSDKDAKYFYWNSETNPWYDPSVEINRGRESSSYNERWLLALPRSQMPAGYSSDAQADVIEFQPDAGALKSAGSYNVGDADYGLYQGVFSMPSMTDDSADLDVQFFYSDGYFMEDPKQYNDHLATMSFALALASSYSNMGNKGSADGLYDTVGNGSTYYPVKCSNAVKLLKDLGVRPDDIYVNEYNGKKPEVNSMGVTIGSKRIGNKTLVILGARGSGYEAEWASNVSLGAVGEAEGFSSAASIAFGDLQAYLEDHGIDGWSENTLFWLSGFSRAGATVNLTAKRIVDTYDNTGARTFAYPLEAPKGGLDSEEVEGCDYTCIHNVINNEDIVPYVAPAEMGFKRYGVDHYVPGTSADSNNIQMSQNTVEIYDDDGNLAESVPVTTYRDNEPLVGDTYKSLRAEMVKQLYAINGDVIYDDYFYQATLNFVFNAITSSDEVSLVGEVKSENAKIASAAEYIPLFMDDLTSKALNYATIGNAKTDDYRRFYSSEILRGEKSFQQALSTVCGIAFSLSDQELDGLVEVLGTIMDRINATDLYSDLFRSKDSKWSSYSSYAEISNGIIDKTTDDLWNAVATRDEQKGFKSLYDVLDASTVEQMHAVWKPLAFPLLYWAHFDYQDNSSDYLGTMVYNVKRILLNHYPEVVVSYLRGSDSYYSGGANDSYYAFKASDQEAQSPRPAVEVTHVAEDGTTTTEVVPQEEFDDPICLTSARDTITLCTESSDVFSRVYCKYAGSNEWQLFGDSATFADLIKMGECQQDSPTSLLTSISFYALESAMVSDTRSVDITYEVFAQTPYVNAMGEDQEPEQARCLTAADAGLLCWDDTEGGWYAATEDLVMSDRVTVEGKVNLILCDGVTLEVPLGMQVGTDAELVIWCQDGATGALKAGSADEIGDSTLENLSGIGVSSAVGAGSVVINGGAITCHGGKNAAGIGGGFEDSDGSVVINNGTVTAVGGEGGAGIGSGAGGGVAQVSILGGTVMATGGEGAAGIGGSDSSLILSWTHEEDSITASSYACNTLELQNDFKFSDGTAGVTSEDVLGSKGKTLVPGAHVHAFAYAADGDTITAICGKPRCTLDGSAVALTLVAENATYDGVPHEARVEGLDAFVETTGVSVGAVSYTKDGLPVDAPVDAGGYEAILTVGDATAHTAFVVDKAVWSSAAAQTTCAVGNNGSLDLFAFVAPGGVVGEPTKQDLSGVLDGALSIEDELLSFAVANDNALVGVSATIEVPVTGATNYADYTISVEVTVSDAVSPGTVPSFKKQSLVLSGQIGVNFFMDLPVIDGVDYTQSYMEFSVGSRKVPNAGYNARKKSKDGLYYGFTCYVNSIQMAEPITATFHYGDGQTVVQSNASVQNYVRVFDRVVKANEGQFSQQAISLVHAIADYGYHAQPFLSAENGWKMGTDYAAMKLCYTDTYDVAEIQGLLSGYKCSKSLGESGLSNVSVRLNLESSTSLDFMFTVPEGYNVEIGESAYEIKKVSATRWYVCVPNISAHELGNDVVVTGTTDGGPFSLTASPLAYANIILTTDAVDSVGTAAFCSFYEYYATAMAYNETL